MKYELETIPVWEAFKADSECPVCLLAEKCETQYVGYFLGDSIMDPATRVAVNKKGFCVYHSSLLFEGGHKLGLALMTHTYLREWLEGFRRKLKEEAERAGKRKAPAAWPAFLQKPLAACLFCERLDQTVDRYVFTIVYLYKKDADFKKTFLAAKGYCLPHCARVLEMAERMLTGALREEFAGNLLSLEERRLDVLENEIEWYTQKFDYRNQDKPWGHAADALPRALKKLKGYRFTGK